MTQRSKPKTVNMRGAYLNRIAGGRLVGVCEGRDRLEIRYQKDGIEQSLVILAKQYGGSMGYGSAFVFHSIALWGVCEPSARFEKMEAVAQITLHKKESYGFGDYEEIEILFIDAKGEKVTFVVRTETDFEEGARLVIEEGVSALPEVSFGHMSLPAELYDTQVYNKVLAFAMEAHETQKRPDGLPYAYHFVSVANEIIHGLSFSSFGYDEANVAIACAMLHGVLEKTGKRLHEQSIDIPFMQMVVEGVMALTKDRSLPSTTRLNENLQHLKKMPPCIQSVRLADCIVNLSSIPIFWNETKRLRYRDEAVMIHETLKAAHPYLANRLKERIANFRVKGTDRYLLAWLDEEKPAFLVLDKSDETYPATFKALWLLHEALKSVRGKGLFKERAFGNYWYANASTPMPPGGAKSRSLHEILALQGLDTCNEECLKHLEILKKGKSCIKS